MRPVEIHNTTLDGLYVVAHQWGPIFSGFGGGKLFHHGLIDGPMSGFEIRQNGMATCAVFFEAVEGHILKWGGAEWLYEDGLKPLPQCPQYGDECDVAISDECLDCRPDIEAMDKASLKALCVERGLSVDKRSVVKMREALKG